MNAGETKETFEISSADRSDLMLAQINDIVASMMVLPNRQVFPLVSGLQVGHLRWSNPQVNAFCRIRCRRNSDRRVVRVSFESSSFKLEI